MHNLRYVSAEILLWLALFVIFLLMDDNSHKLQLVGFYATRPVHNVQMTLNRR